MVGSGNLAAVVSRDSAALMFGLLQGTGCCEALSGSDLLYVLPSDDADNGTPGYILFQMALHAELPPGNRELPVLIFYTCPFFTGLPYPDSFLRAVLYNSVFFISLAVACVLILISSRCLAVKLKRRTWR